MLINTSRKQRRNLQDRSFKNRDLTGQDFSFTDIRGADFTGANLTGAKFNYALAGLTKSQIIIIFIVTAILSIIAGIAAVVAVDIPTGFILPKPTDITPINVGAVVFIFLEFVNISILIITVSQSIQKTIGYLFSIIPITMVIISILAALGIGEENAREYYALLGKFIGFLGITEAQFVDWTGKLRYFRFSSIIQNLNDGSSIDLIASFIVSVFAIFVLIFTLSLAVALAEIIAEKWLGNIAVAGAATLATITVGIITKNLHDHYEYYIFYLWMVVIPAIALSLVLILITRRIAKKILAEDENNLFILKFAVAIGAIKGTNFENANLTDADFSHAILKSTNFQFANVTRTFWRQTKYLKFARVETTILVDIKIRELLITGWGKDQEYIGANLRGANLISADLSNANLKLADLGEASLKAACLNNANLAETLAIGTNFTTAQMSGTCLEAWNIDHTTILDNIESKYIYLLEKPKPETDDRERRPSSGYFQAGDFTKLFEEVLNTVDLIFRDGVDATAFMSSFQEVKVENEGIPMTIQGMENKGDGVVVIKINVPPETDKEKIHREFMQIYGETIQYLEEKHQHELKEIQKQINQNIQESDRKHQIELAKIKKENARSEEQNQNMRILVDQIVQKSTSANYLVILNFEGGNFATGFPVIRANIWLDSHPLPISLTGKLTPNLRIPQLYQEWNQKYKQLREYYRDLDLLPRIKIKQDQTTNFSKKDMEKEAQKIIKEAQNIIIQIQELEKEWRSLINYWLNDPNFNEIEEELRTRFNLSDKVRLIIQSENILMQRFPWHLWNFFSGYQFAETAIGLPKANRVEKLNIVREKIRILAIFGDDKGINIQKDKEYLESFSRKAEIVSLVKPTKQELDEKLWDEKGWDILCFSGHSYSEKDGSSGYFYLENETKMTIEELENSLATAIRKGLQLAIFNSCDGLGLARQFARLHIPAIIVMREEVADVVAQKFFQDFLKSFASGKSLYISVREAREKLQVMEDKFPGASWLPVICQNSAEIPPLFQLSVIGENRENLEGKKSLNFAPLAPQLWGEQE